MIANWSLHRRVPRERQSAADAAAAAAAGQQHELPAPSGVRRLPRGASIGAAENYVMQSVGYVAPVQYTALAVQRVTLFISRL